MGVKKKSSDEQTKKEKKGNCLSLAKNKQTPPSFFWRCESCVHLSWQFLFFHRYTNIATHRLSGLVMLRCWLERWRLSVCVGAGRRRCIVSGCLCNLDVHRKATFSIMMCSDAIKTLVYSLVCLDFGQYIVYINKYVEDFLEVFCLILRTLLQMPFFFFL